MVVPNSGGMVSRLLSADPRLTDVCNVRTFSFHLFVAHVISAETCVHSSSLFGMYLKINKQNPSSYFAFFARKRYNERTFPFVFHMFYSEISDSVGGWMDGWI
jgi:hypothetical protein